VPTPTEEAEQGERSGGCGKGERRRFGDEAMFDQEVRLGNRSDRRLNDNQSIFRIVLSAGRGKWDFVG
jgi:hypothetical protein